MSSHSYPDEIGSKWFIILDGNRWRRGLSIGCWPSQDELDQTKRERLPRLRLRDRQQGRLLVFRMYSSPRGKKNPNKAAQTNPSKASSRILSQRGFVEYLNAGVAAGGFEFLSTPDTGIHQHAIHLWVRIDQAEKWTDTHTHTHTRTLHHSQDPNPELRLETNRKSRGLSKTDIVHRIGFRQQGRGGKRVAPFCALPSTGKQKKGRLV